MNDCIYFIREGDDGPIKIGRTGARSPEHRLAQCQTGNARRLKLLGFFHGPFDVEAQWHRRFAELRLEGEWFQATPELIVAIREALARRPNMTAVEAVAEAEPKFKADVIAWGVRNGLDRQQMADRCGFHYATFCSGLTWQTKRIASAIETMTAGEISAASLLRGTEVHRERMYTPRYENPDQAVSA